MSPTKKILICDDEEGVRESLKLILEDDYNLVVIDSPEQCLEVLKNDKSIGLVLLDIKMPKINGLELLPQIKKTFPSLNVIMVTGYKSVEMAQEASRHGASSYIIKPFKSAEILEKVRENLKNA